jgi:hypothetical protein
MCALALLAVAAARPPALALPAAPASGAAQEPWHWHETGILPATADEPPPHDPGMVKVSVPEARRLLNLAITPITSIARHLGYAWSNGDGDIRHAPVTTITKHACEPPPHDPGVTVKTCGSRSFRLSRAGPVRQLAHTDDVQGSFTDRAVMAQFPGAGRAPAAHDQRMRPVVGPPQLVHVAVEAGNQHDSHSLPPDAPWPPANCRRLPWAKR